MIPEPQNPPVQAVAGSGPIAYMQNTSAYAATGSVARGTSSALIAVMSGSAAPQNVFETDTLQVSGAGSSTASIARSARSMSVAASGGHAPEAFAADDSLLLSQLHAHVETMAVAARAESAQRSAVAVNATSGTQASIWVQEGGFASHNFVAVPATLVAQTTHGNIWTQNSLLSTVSPNATQIGNDFENAYASDTAHFASPDYASNAPGMQPQYGTCSSSGSHTGTASAYIAEPADHRINVMIVDSSTLGVGGYFSSVNLMTQAALNCLGSGYESNEAPFIYIGWYSGYGTQYEVQEDSVRSTAHELQHLINFVNHSILAPAAANASYNGNEAQYVNEGLSMLAQDFAVDRMYGAQGVHVDAADAVSRAAVYLASPQSYSISGFSGVDPAQWGGNGSPQYNCSGGCYGGAYLFERYLNDRFGDAFTHNMETSGQVGTANLQSVTGESSAQLFGDFALAMAANTLGVSGDPRFSFGLNLMGSYPDQFGHTAHLGGIASTTESSSNASVTVPVGGFAFISVPNVPASGMSVQVTDQASASGFDLLGGLAQR